MLEIVTLGSFHLTLFNTTAAVVNVGYRRRRSKRRFVMISSAKSFFEEGPGEIKGLDVGRRCRPTSRFQVAIFKYKVTQPTSV